MLAVSSPGIGGRWADAEEYVGISPQLKKTKLPLFALLCRWLVGGDVKKMNDIRG